MTGSWLVVLICGSAALVAVVSGTYRGWGEWLAQRRETPVGGAGALADAVAAPVVAVPVAEAPSAVEPSAVEPFPVPSPDERSDPRADNRTSYGVQSVDDLLAAADAMSRPPAFGRAARRPGRTGVPDAAALTGGGPRSGDTPAPAVDASVLESLLAGLDGPRGTLRDAVVTTYLDEGSVLVGRLVMAALDGSAEAVLLIAPGLRSTCAMLGAARLDALLGEMEDAARTDHQRLASLAWAVDAEHSRVAAAVVVISEESTSTLG